MDLIAFTAKPNVVTCHGVASCSQAEACTCLTLSQVFRVSEQVSELPGRLGQGALTIRQADVVVEDALPLNSNDLLQQAMAEIGASLATIYHCHKPSKSHKTAWHRNRCNACNTSDVISMCYPACGRNQSQQTLQP